VAEVRWTLTASADLESIETFIAVDSVLHAVHFVDRLVASTEKLAASPRVGRVVPEFRRDDLREVFFRGYRIVYRVDGTAVTILRVVHGARDLQGLAGREPWEFQ
jgi:plasmid stabilization system protein ParE